MVNHTICGVHRVDACRSFPWWSHPGWVAGSPPTRLIPLEEPHSLIWSAVQFAVVCGPICINYMTGWIQRWSAKIRAFSASKGEVLEENCLQRLPRNKARSTIWPEERERFLNLKILLRASFSDRVLSWNFEHCNMAVVLSLSTFRVSTFAELASLTVRLAFRLTLLAKLSEEIESELFSNCEFQCYRWLFLISEFLFLIHQNDDARW